MDAAKACGCFQAAIKVILPPEFLPAGQGKAALVFMGAGAGFGYGHSRDRMLWAHEWQGTVGPVGAAVGIAAYGGKEALAMLPQVVYQPRILHGLAEICVFMGVGRETVKSWQEQGAPIIMERRGGKVVWLSELAALWNWRLEKERGNGGF